MLGKRAERGDGVYASVQAGARPNGGLNLAGRVVDADGQV